MVDALRAGPILPLEAGSTTPAREEVGEHHPVAHSQRRPVRVTGHALAERRDAPGPLMPRWRGSARPRCA